MGMEPRTMSYEGTLQREVGDDEDSLLILEVFFQHVMRVVACHTTRI